MGIKITELTSASTLVGNELTPLIQSTETRQTAVSSVYTALTAQNDTRYVRDMVSSAQGCLTFTGSGGGNLNLGVAQTSDVIFAGLTANDDSLVDGDLVITSHNKLCSRGEFCSLSSVNIDGPLQANGNTILGNCSSNTLIIKGCSITLDNTLPAGVDNSVVILDSDKTLRTDEIDSSVWGGKLVDYCGSLNVCGTGGCSGGGGTTTINNNVNIAGSKSLTVTGNITVGGGNVILNCLPTSDPNISGGLWHSGGLLRISCAT